MNLAIEYFIRSGLAKEGLQLPCAFFIYHYQTNDKVIITIDYDELYKIYIIRKWILKETAMNSIFPPYEEKNINKKEDIFESNESIIPEYKIIEYQEEPYESYSYVNPEDITSENEYFTATTGFANTIKHKKYRRKWLWDSFCEAFNKHEKTDINIIKEKWKQWVLFFDINRNLGKVSPDLSFFESYQNKNGHYKRNQYLKNINKHTHNYFDYYGYFRKKIDFKPFLYSDNLGLYNF